MLMQMLAAGGMTMLIDERREADEDNPRGYLEYEPVKSLLKDASWLKEARGKVVKIVAPLLSALPPGLPCRVILSERDLDEVLDSQEKMLARRGKSQLAAPERRKVLRDEYGRTLARVRGMLARRPVTEVLIVEHREAMRDAAGTAEKVNRFLGGRLDVGSMAAAIDPTLHRNKAS